jgi:hypothetical protein
VENKEIDNKEDKVIKKRKINKDEVVECKNITNGTLVYISKKTGAEYVMEGYGATENFEVGELITMKASYGKILTEPWMIILDDDIVDYLGLRHIYDKIVVPLDKIDSFFDKSVTQMKKALQSAPNGIKSLIASRARTLISEEKLDSISKIKLIEQILNVELI